MYKKYDKTEPRYELIEDYDWWSVKDTTGRIKPVESYLEGISGQEVVDLLNRYERRVRELQSENDILRDVMDTDSNKLTNSIIDLNDNISKERAKADRIRLERNALIKWYKNVKFDRTMSFNARELAYITGLEEEE